MWFTEDGIVNGGSGAIGRITTTGELSEYILPTLPGSSSGAGDITVGPDGNLWFTWAAQAPTDDLDAAVLSSIGRIDTGRRHHRVPTFAGSGLAPRRYRLGPRREPLAHARRGEHHRPDLRDGHDHIVPAPERGQLPGRYHEGKARRDVVQRSERDRTIQGATRRLVHRTTRTCRGSRKAYVRTISGCSLDRAGSRRDAHVAAASVSSRFQDLFQHRDPLAPVGPHPLRLLGVGKSLMLDRRGAPRFALRREERR